LAATHAKLELGLEVSSETKENGPSNGQMEVI
jgi:hypothetical protein